MTRSLTSIEVSSSPLGFPLGSLPLPAMVVVAAAASAGCDVVTPPMSATLEEGSLPGLVVVVMPSLGVY